MTERRSRWDKGKPRGPYPEGRHALPHVTGVSLERMAEILKEGDGLGRVSEHEYIIEADPAGNTYGVFWVVSGLPGLKFQNPQAAEEAALATRAAHVLHELGGSDE